MGSDGFLCPQGSCLSILFERPCGEIQMGVRPSSLLPMLIVFSCFNTASFNDPYLDNGDGQVPT